jgi:hypothetical protein
VDKPAQIPAPIAIKRNQRPKFSAACWMVAGLLLLKSVREDQEFKGGNEKGRMKGAESRNVLEAGGEISTYHSTIDRTRG